jgi:hypothetical protein
VIVTRKNKNKNTRFHFLFNQKLKVTYLLLFRRRRRSPFFTYPFFSIDILSSGIPAKKK